MKNKGWIDATIDLPDHLEAVWISNGKGWTSMGCIVKINDEFHWAESNGVVYEDNGVITAECESDDLDVKFWHKFPKACKQ